MLAGGKRLLGQGRERGTLMTKIAKLLGIALICLTAASLPAQPPPRVFQLAGADLARVKRRAAGDRQLAAALARLVAQAERELKTKPLTIVHKPKAPPSGDRH